MTIIHFEDAKVPTVVAALYNAAVPMDPLTFNEPEMTAEAAAALVKRCQDRGVTRIEQHAGKQLMIDVANPAWDLRLYELLNGTEAKEHALLAVAFGSPAPNGEAFRDLDHFSERSQWVEQNEISGYLNSLEDLFRSPGTGRYQSPSA